MIPLEDELRAALLDLAHQRGIAKSFCPSEVARALSTEWRPLMAPIRRVASDLIREGRLIATQKGRPVDPEQAKGPIRLALRPSHCS
ncbi:DUF3253 domain-containing protein [Dinoroseobacter sp. S375]|uniref:DUF3253 domain-containing protein n=1 Tax=Dinoroseobacter sp. S375 TaxID=3415136 RepID=UPI003C7C24A8